MLIFLAVFGLHSLSIKLFRGIVPVASGPPPPNPPNAKYQTQARFLIPSAFS